MAFPPEYRLVETTSALHPEIVKVLEKLKETKKNSRLIIRKSEIKWRERGKQAYRDALLIDPRNGFANSICNIGIAEIPPGGRTGRHKHTEAYVYILRGRGYSIIGDKKVEWEAGDALYIPPDTPHQHFNTGDEPVFYLRVVPGPLILNLLALLAAINASFEGSFVQYETAPEYQGPRLTTYWEPVEGGSSSEGS